MRIALLFNDRGFIPILEPLIQRGQLVGLATETLGQEDIVMAGVKLIAQAQKIPHVTLTKRKFAQQLDQWLRASQPDVVLVYILSYKIPAALLDRPPYGFFNFHYGLLPHYRGPDTLFWPIRNQEPRAGITVHKMDADWDTGPIVFTRSIALEPRDTRGILRNKLVPMVPEAALDLVSRLSDQGEQLPLTPQAPGTGRYWPRPKFQDLCINWQAQPSLEVDALVRACNDCYDGALTFLRGTPIRIRQVTVLPVAESQQSELSAIPPGTIVVASPDQGLLVCTCDRALVRLEVVQSPEGIFSGPKLLELFAVQPGERLEIPEQYQEYRG
jgi:methionyl-tRNA formyltransferase